MEVKPGYKQTEVGVIPKEWEVLPITSVLQEGSRITYGVVKPGSSRDDGVLFIRGGDVFDGTILTDQLRTISKEISNQYKRTRLSGGELVISLVGYPGEVALVPHSLAGANIARQVALVRLDSTQQISGDYICKFLQSNQGRRLLLKESIGSAQQVINLRDITRVVLVLPPLPEQRAIATALSDVDGLLGGLDRLIAKKRDLKQAAMQQLLTGQIRLPGFHGEWEETTFGSVVRHHAGNSTLIKGKLPSSQATGRFPAYSASGQDVWCDHFEYEGDAIVVSAVGSRCGKAFQASGKWCAIANTHVVWPNTAKINTRFLAYFINDEDFWQKSGTGQPFVLFTKTFARPLRLPKLPEQTAIAEVLTEMDGELAGLEQRREKTRALKQAMMQELLTGRTRLV